MVSKASLLYGLRDELLELLSEASGMKHQGLAQAARQCKSANLLDGTVCNKLVSLDYAYNLVRHLTTQHVTEHVLAIQGGLTKKAEEKVKEFSAMDSLKLHIVKAGDAKRHQGCFEELETVKALMIKGSSATALFEEGVEAKDTDNDVKIKDEDADAKCSEESTPAKKPVNVVKDDMDNDSKATAILERLEKTELLEDQLALQMQQMQEVQQLLLHKQQRKQQRQFRASMTALPENGIEDVEEVKDENKEGKPAKILMKDELELKKEESSMGDQSL